MPFIDKFYANCSRKLHTLDVTTILKIKYTINNIIRRGKDKISDKDHTNVVYKISCDDCDASCVGETKRALEARTDERKKHSTSAVKHTPFSIHRNTNVGHSW